MRFDCITHINADNIKAVSIKLFPARSIDSLNTNKSRDRIYLMNTVAGAAALYGVEVWGWGEAKEIEKIQGIFCKMALGVNRNTPGYIWRAETGVQNIKVTMRKRAARYVKDVLAMEDDRWPKIALREEMRGIINRNPKKEEDKKAIERSTYNKIYKRIMIEEDEYNYWKEDKKRGEDKEQWARIRCGNIGRAYKKGYTEFECRLCKESLETLAHLTKCKEVKKGVNEEERKYLEKWDKLVDEEEIERKICSILKGEIDTNLCEIFRKIEKLIKRKTEADKGGDESAEEEQRTE
ncbi:uncharacterized protein LOC123275051 [Cotesia glomerata]|uniref:uncharacterized protein LOC123275051 n=1 Tax=Cotesia glomerata TaxID=32391 RepID=UPI001D00EFBA|nr:uncharacterized protein LOC123275051 [Cotesia glomerata]